MVPCLAPAPARFGQKAVDACSTPDRGPRRPVTFPLRLPAVLLRGYATDPLSVTPRKAPGTWARNRWRPSGLKAVGESGPAIAGALELPSLREYAARAAREWVRAGSRPGEREGGRPRPLPPLRSRGNGRSRTPGPTHGRPHGRVPVFPRGREGMGASGPSTWRESDPGPGRESVHGTFGPRSLKSVGPSGRRSGQGGSGRGK
jgi:hypothetical protein